jgi:hypothetical protein
MKNNIPFIESEVIRLFGIITPVSVSSYIQMLRDEQEFDNINHQEYIKWAQRLLINIYATSPKESKVVADDIKQDMGAYYSKTFQVPYDWMSAANNRELNAKCFFKLYTMQNDSRDILWQMKHNNN